MTDLIHVIFSKGTTRVVHGDTSACRKIQTQAAHHVQRLHVHAWTSKASSRIRGVLSRAGTCPFGVPDTSSVSCMVCVSGKRGCSDAIHIVSVIVFDGAFVDSARQRMWTSG